MMKPLYSQEEYDLARSCVKLPFECYQCSKTFYVEKKLVKSYLKRGIVGQKYCSTDCQSKAKVTSIIKPCAQCNAQVIRKLAEFKSSKQGNVFCNASCAATYNNTHKTKGTRRSKLEAWIESQLPTLYPNLSIDFNNKKVINSELDIYIPSLNLAFELQGIFHFKPIYGIRKLAQIQANDAIKSQLCQASGITLIAIDVSTQQRFTIESSKKYLNSICNSINKIIYAI